MKRIFIILSITFACMQKANAQAAEILQVIQVFLLRQVKPLMALR